MGSTQSPGDKEHPEMTVEDRKLVLLLDFLDRARKLGIQLSVTDLEGLLPAFGIPLFGGEHWILVLSDHEALSEQGAAPPLEQLIPDYPCWKRDIELELKTRKILGKSNPSENLRKDS